MRMGARPELQFNTLNFKGRITQMQVYNLALTQKQIQTTQKRTQREGKLLSDTVHIKALDEEDYLIIGWYACGHLVILCKQAQGLSLFD